MSILLVEVVPQGMIFGADRNITLSRPLISSDGTQTEYREEFLGYSQRPKVLRWPQRKALIGYVGAGSIGRLPAFEERNNTMAPTVWVIRNDHNPPHLSDIRREFEVTEAFWQKFSAIAPQNIRSYLDTEYASHYEPFWFHQGIDLGTFNVIEGFLKLAFRSLCQVRPDDHCLPQSIEEWERQVRMSILTYGAYFQAYKQPHEYYVGGGVDTVSIAWPE